MAKNKIKQKNMSKPVENHQTAAWSNIEELKPESRVFIPNETEVINAKEWVDKNQK
ncbi:DUF3787 domain-containing protein [Clostridiaceae bacterium 35-E11]